MAGKHRLGQAISFGAGIVVVGLLAIAIGYFMGNYAVRMVTGPKVTPSQETTGSRETAPSQAAAPPAPSPEEERPVAPAPAEPLAIQLNDEQYEPAKEVATQADLSSQLFKVQVGEFGDREEARQLAARLKGDGHTVYVTSLAPYRVQVGAFELRERAEKLAAEVRGRGYEPVTIQR